MGCRQIEDARVRTLNDEPPRAQAQMILYWMQQSQRARCNHALEYAIQQANRHRVPLIVGFGLTDGYPEANARHFHFMLEGLRQVRGQLEQRGIKLIVQRGDPAEVALELGRHARLIVCDRGYLRHQKQWRSAVAREARCQVLQVESDLIVPVREASDKREFAARTLRSKLQGRSKEFMRDLDTTALSASSLGLRYRSVDLEDISAVVQSLDVDHAVKPTAYLQGGYRHARRLLRRFVDEGIDRYDSERNRPELDAGSFLSPYLHFGQIGPLEVALAVREHSPASAGRKSFIEELLVRRELAHNFVEFTPNYDEFACLPAWAKESLAAHRDDPRKHHYTRSQLEKAETHDRYWNAAMAQMKATGFLHNYMRMYWGKKILEWSNTPEYAYKTALYLNNKYFVDGRDANSFANVGWIFGLHDRPFSERAIFGKVRYLSASGLERKSDVDAYLEKVKRLVREEATD